MPIIITRRGQAIQPTVWGVGLSHDSPTATQDISGCDIIYYQELSKRYMLAIEAQGSKVGGGATDSAVVPIL